MERMERRLAILQKRSKQDQPDTEPLQQNTENTSLTETTAAPKIRTHRDSVVNSEKHFRNRSHSQDHVNRTGRSSRVSSRSGTPVLQDVYEPSGGSSSAKRNTKRKLSGDSGLEGVAKKRRSRQNEMRTRVEYTGLDLPQQYDGCTGLDRLTNHSGSGSNAELANSVASSSVSGCSGTDEKAAVMNGTLNTTILVPSWRTYTAPGKAGNVEGGEVC